MGEMAEMMQVFCANRWCSGLIPKVQDRSVAALCFATILASPCELAAATSTLAPNGASAFSNEAPYYSLVQAESEDASEGIRDVQRDLATLGLYNGAIDGLTGPATSRAVVEFLERAGLSREFDRPSRDRLAEAAQIADAGLLPVSGAIERSAELVEAKGLFEEGRRAFARGQYSRSVEFYAQAARTYQLLLGQEHEQTLGVLSNLGLGLHFGGSYADAEGLHRHVLSVRERILSPGDPVVSESLHNLGMSVFSLGRYPEAESLFRRAHAIMEAALGPDDPNTIASLSELASSIDAQRRPEDAEPLYRRAFAASECVLGVEHGATLNTSHNLGINLSRQGKYAGAEAALRRTGEIRSRILGEEHPETLRSFNVLAGVLADMGRYDEAEGIFRRVLAARERVLGKEHPDTLISLGFLGNALFDAERYNDAAEVFARAFSSWNKVLGPDHPDTLRTAYALFRAHAFSGNADAAADALKDGIALLPAFFASEGNAIYANGDGSLPADLSHYLFALAQGILEGPESVDLMFQLQGWQSFGKMDLTLTDLAARLSAASGQEASILRELQEAREAMRYARDAFISEYYSQEENSSHREALARDLSAAEADFRQITERMARDYPTLAELQMPRPLTLPEAQKWLRPGEGLVTYALVHNRLYAWFVTRDNVISWYAETTPESLEARVAHLRSPFEFDAEPKADEVDGACAFTSSFPGMEGRPFDICAAQAMHELLLGGFELDGIEELIVVPDGPLEQLPFSLLVGGTDTDGSPHWLIEDLAISTLPATSSLKALRLASQQSGQRIAQRLPYLGIAPVTFDGLAQAPVLRSGRYDLPSTSDEVRFIAGTLA